MGTLNKKLPQRSKYKIDDYAGKRFGTRTVIKKTERRNGYQMWVMRCDCGREEQVATTHLMRGRANSCKWCARGVARGVDSPGWRGCGAVTGTAYRNFVAQAERRGIEWKLTIEFVAELFEKQGGKCAMTGDDIHFFRGDKHGRGNASIDRIDSDGGYVPGNIHLVTKQVNFAKQSLSMDDFVDMCRRVATKFDRGKNV